MMRDLDDQCYIHIRINFYFVRMLSRLNKIFCELYYLIKKKIKSSSCFDRFGYRVSKRFEICNQLVQYRNEVRERKFSRGRYAIK